MGEYCEEAEGDFPDVTRRARWSAKGDATLADPPISDLLRGRAPVHILWRRGNEGAFRYAGMGVVKEARGTVPATVLWTCVRPKA